MTVDSESLVVSLDDLEQDVAKYGMDIHPLLDVRNEITRTHDLFQELQERWPDLYQELSFRPESSEFKILASFGFEAGSIRFPTLISTRRGLVFAFPHRLPAPLGHFTHKESLDDVVLASLGVVRKIFPGLEVLRLGLIREVIFTTGKSSSVPYLADRFGLFPGTSPKGGSVALTFTDDRCNVRITIETIKIERKTQVPQSGHVLAAETTYGFKVTLDVNNIEIRPQEASEMQTTLERANCLWPKELVEFMNWRRSHNEH